MRLRGALAIALAFLTTSGFARAQDEPKVDQVTFLTVDGVKLVGAFYPSPEGRKSPCVMMLHKYGSDRTKGDWDLLAKKLQKDGFSVLTFDFRGHGKSKDLSDKVEFWNIAKYPYNKASGGRLNDGRIDATKFSNAYFPWLINDIAAARKYLDEKNDAGECNSGRIFIIAERDMGTLALLWTGSEYGRFGIAPTPTNPRPTHVAGSDVSGLVFLSAMRRPRGLTMPFDYTTPAARKLWQVKDSPVGDPLKIKQSMCFIYGATDTASATDAKFFYDTLFGATTVAKNEQIKFLVPIKDTKLAGVELLGKQTLNVENSITDYLGEVKKRGIGNNWIEREVNKMPFVPVPLTDIGFAAVK